MSGPLTSQFPVTSTMVGGVYNTVTPAPADTEGCALQLDSSGNLKVTTVGGGAGASNYLTYSSTLVNTVTAVKAAAGAVYGWEIFYNGTAASIAYVQFFNLGVGGVTLGTTPPFFSIGLTAGQSVQLFNTGGIVFGTAISIAATSTRSNATTPTVALDVNIWYL